MLTPEQTAGLSPARLLEYGTRDAAPDARWRPTRHLEYLDSVLMEAVQGGGSVIVTLGPRNGKSTLIDVGLPAWWLGTNPDKPVILTTNGADLSSDFGGQARDLLTRCGPEVLGVEVDGRSSAEADWSIRGRRGSMRSVGVGGPITGRGGYLLICDDPVKNAEQHGSDAYRRMLREWWGSTFMSRAEPGAVVIVAGCRWGSDDFAAWLLEEFPGEFNHVHLPAMALEDDPLGRKPGDALWPSRWPLPALEKVRRRMGSRWFEIQHQGNVSAEADALFHPAWIERIPADADYETHVGQRVRAWDLASSERRSADWTAGALVASLVTEEGTGFAVEDVVRKRVSPAAQEDLILTTAQADGHEVRISIPVDPGSAGKAWFEHLRHRLYEFDVIATRPTSAKQVRWTPMLAAYERGDVGHVEGSWNREVEDELKRLPSGKHDDCADALADAINLLSAGTYRGQPQITIVGLGG